MPVDATVVPAARTDLAAQATAPEMERKLHPRKISLETIMDNKTIMDNNKIPVALTATEQEQLVCYFAL